MNYQNQYHRTICNSNHMGSCSLTITRLYFPDYYGTTLRVKVPAAVNFRAHRSELKNGITVAAYGFSHERFRDR